MGGDVFKVSDTEGAVRATPHPAFRHLLITFRFSVNRTLSRPSMPCVERHDRITTRDATFSVVSCSFDEPSDSCSSGRPSTPIPNPKHHPAHLIIPMRVDPIPRHAQRDQRLPDLHRPVSGG